MVERQIEPMKIMKKNRNWCNIIRTTSHLWRKVGWFILSAFRLDFLFKDFAPIIATAENAGERNITEQPDFPSKYISSILKGEGYS
jgi:hypothetical protein